MQPARNTINLMQNRVTYKIVRTLGIAVVLVSVVQLLVVLFQDRQLDDETLRDIRQRVIASLVSWERHDNAIDPKTVVSTLSAVLPVDVHLSRIVVSARTTRRILVEDVPPPSEDDDDTSFWDHAEQQAFGFLSGLPQYQTIATTVRWRSNGRVLPDALATVKIDYRDRKGAHAEAFFTLIELVTVAGLLCILATFYSVLHWVNRPAEAIIRVSKKIADGHTDMRLAIQSDDEFGAIMRAFNELTDTLLTKQMLADTDGLTQIFNHRYIQETIIKDITHAAKTAGSMAIILIDLNKFKLLNDTYGHIVGDRRPPFCAARFTWTALSAGTAAMSSLSSCRIRAAIGHAQPPVEYGT